MIATPDTPSANKFSILSKVIPPIATIGRLVFKIISFSTWFLGAKKPEEYNLF